MSVQMEKWRFTVDQYHRLAEIGILFDRDRVELIEGEIIRKGRPGSEHSSRVMRLHKRLGERIDDCAIISIHNPIQLSEYSGPSQIFALLKYRKDFYIHETPSVESTLLVVEVSDTTLGFDKEVKIPLYARHGVSEVWLDIIAPANIEVYSKPVNGKYESFRIVERGESISPEMLPTLVLTADEILG